MKHRVVIEVEDPKQALELSNRLRKFRDNPAPLPSRLLATKLRAAKSIVAEELPVTNQP